MVDVGVGCEGGLLLSETGKVGKYMGASGLAGLSSAPSASDDYLLVNPKEHRE